GVRDSVPRGAAELLRHGARDAGRGAAVEEPGADADAEAGVSDHGAAAALSGGGERYPRELSHGLPACAGGSLVG
ncbi:hypothetical protein DQE84_19310, partial [Staphylococcus warneri]